MQPACTIDATCTLNDKQFAILVQLATEDTREQIAEKFELSVGGVDKNIGIIYAKLNVHTRQGATDKAWMLGIFTKENRK